MLRLTLGGFLGSSQLLDWTSLWQSVSWSTCLCLFSKSAFIYALSETVFFLLAILVTFYFVVFFIYLLFCNFFIRHFSKKLLQAALLSHNLLHSSCVWTDRFSWVTMVSVISKEMSYHVWYMSPVRRDRDLITIKRPVP